MVLIVEDFDRSRLARLLEGWRIDEATHGQPESDGGPGVTLTRAVLAAAENR